MSALFALAKGLLVYSAHHKRFVGMLRGEEPSSTSPIGWDPAAEPLIERRPGERPAFFL